MYFYAETFPQNSLKAVNFTSLGPANAKTFQAYVQPHLKRSCKRLSYVQTIHNRVKKFCSTLARGVQRWKSTVLSQFCANVSKRL